MAMNVKCAYYDRFPNVILRLSGMYSLMSYMGLIGTRMAESGHNDIMTVALFSDVPKYYLAKFGNVIAL